MLSFFSENIRQLPYVPAWILLVLLLQFAILFYLFLYSPSLIFIPLYSIFDRRIRREIIESHNSFQNRLLNLLDIIFYFSFSLLLFYFTKNHNFFEITLLQNLNAQKAGDLKVYLLIVLFTVSLIFLKKQTFVFLTYLFEDTKRYNIFIFNINMFLKIIGLLILPFIFLLSWNFIQNQEIIYYLLIISTSLYLFLIFFNFLRIHHKTIIDYINFILYFCALELIPSLFFLKFFLRYF